jgi:hypothetical protein
VDECESCTRRAQEHPVTEFLEASTHRTMSDAGPYEDGCEGPTLQPFEAPVERRGEGGTGESGDERREKPRGQPSRRIAAAGGLQPDDQGDETGRGSRSEDDRGTPQHDASDP